MKTGRKISVKKLNTKNKEAHKNKHIKALTNNYVDHSIETVAHFRVNEQGNIYSKRLALIIRRNEIQGK